MSDNQTKQIEWRIANLDCENDAAKIKRTLQDVKGVDKLKIFPKSAKISFTLDPNLNNESGIREGLTKAGFQVSTKREIAKPPKIYKNPKVITSAISGLILGITYFLQMQSLVPELLASVFYAAGMVIGGYFFTKEAIEELFGEFEIGIELLMAIAAISAFFLGEAAEALMLVFLYSISEALEGYTEVKTRSAIQALMDLSPKFALVKRNGKEVEVPVEEIKTGDVFIVKPGQSIPTDGEVVKGASSVNQAPITGESIPVLKEVSATVFAGTLNEEGSLEVKATKTFENNTLARIIHLVEDAQEEKGKSEKFIKKFGKKYSPAVLLAGILILLLPGFFTGDWYQWAVRATIFIVAASPCALVISIPISMVSAIGTAARNGVLIKGGIYLEELYKVNSVCLDKTGTITKGTPEVTDLISFNNFPKEKVLKYAASIEKLSQHPLAKAIVDESKKQNLVLSDAENFISYTGKGVSAKIDGANISVGSPNFFLSEKNPEVEAVSNQITNLQQLGKTVIVIMRDKKLLGLIAVRDKIRENVKNEITKMKELGIKEVMILTGDNELTASAISKEVGADKYFAELQPEDKAVKVKELIASNRKVLMVGDGVNDAPALASATVGAAMGAAGTDVALETADIALMGDNLSKLTYALKLAKRTKKVVNQNLFLSIAVISVLIVVALTGISTLTITIFGHEASELIIILNGLRLLKS